MGVSGQAVIFDFYDTLAWLDPERVAAGRRRVADVLGVTVEALGVAYRESFPGRVLGSYGDGRSEMAHIADRLGIAAVAGLVDRAFRAEVTGWLAAAQLYPDVRPALTRLREAGSRLAILSNCSFQARAVIEEARLPELFDVVVLSCEVGLAKPDPAIFSYALDRLGSPPANTLYVDDLPQHLDSAAGLGMGTALIARRSTTTIEGGRHAVAVDLEQVAQLIRPRPASP